MKKGLIVSSVIVVVLLGVVSMLIYNHQIDRNKYSKTAVEAIEQIRGKGNTSRVLFEQNVDHGFLLFYDVDDDSLGIDVEYIKHTKKGWRWANGGGHGTGEDVAFSSQYIELREATEPENQALGMLFGRIKNTDFDTMIIRDKKTNTERQVTIQSLSDQTRLYYVLLDNAQGRKFVISSYAHNGNLISEQVIDESI